MLAVLAAALRAKAVVEVGTGVGITGLRLLEGMEPDGILTTIDPDPSHQSAAKETFGQAGLEPGRARQITGQPSEVLPRLADGAYDLVLINDFDQDPQSFLDQSRRLLRGGGLVVLRGALGEDAAVTDPAKRDPGTTSLRSAAASLAEDDQLLTALLPVSDGLLIATKRTV